ncbi:hypothetical protein CS063_10140 [Sporanaerobium hydrogeniformans]|uniref:Uncharacterized protein n=1 Tax=Sporanaerobium hydrogeniformans TaxID=3072179 RepID=A0AC61DB01_9FIRM|nr:extracellular solute-binding protein [Sporanaerobium hydrogeniformans]PHV70444.1 hypothetical protein CS063_10140 [Sporanaerobium hydrogeniformans]
MKSKLLMGALSLALCTSLLGGCGSGKGTASEPTQKAAEAPKETAKEAEKPAGEKKTIKFLSIWPEDKDNSKLILELTEEYKKENPNFDMEFEYIAPDDLVSKIKVLLASDDLPDVFAYESGEPLAELIDAGAVVDMEAALQDLGIADCVDEGAKSLLKTLVDGRGLYDLPLGLNIEGMWYNKALFEKAGIAEAPKTWDELEAACDKLMAAGIQPIAGGGKDKWPLTRLLNAYIMRSIGVDAMLEVKQGKRKMTDPEFVKAAEVIQNMVKKGYFGQGVTTVDQGTAVSMVLNGQAAMHYNGSWVTENLNSADNAAGPEGIGYFNIPTVAGGPGKLDEYSMNCGNILTFSSKKYDAATADWVKYVFTRMGDKAITDYGAFKGFKINNMPSSLTYYTNIVADNLKAAKGSSLWFEGRFDAKTSKIAQDYVQTLFNGEITPEEYMTAIQDSLDGK